MGSEKLPSPAEEIAQPTAPRSGTPLCQCEQDWKRHTRAGNSAHACGRHVLARHCYARALDLAEDFLAGAGAAEADRAIPIFVIACHNAGDNLLELGRQTEALGFYGQAFEQVLALAERPEDNAVLAASARRNLTQVTTGLLRLMKETGVPVERVNTILIRAQNLTTAAHGAG